MTDDVSDLLDTGAIERARPRRGRTVTGMVVALALVLAAAAVIGVMVVRDSEDQLLTGLERRLELRAAGRAEVIETWLAGESRLSAQISGADQFRLFASELMAGDGDDELAEQILQITPYMVQALNDFVRQNDLDAAYLVAPDGISLVTSTAAPLLALDAGNLAAAVIADDTLAVTPARSTADGLVTDVLRPVLALHSADPAREPAPVAAFVMTVPLDEEMAAFLAPGTFSQPGEHFALIQTEPTDAPLSFRPDAAAVQVAELAGPADPLAFGERPAVGGDTAVFSVSAPVAGIPWLVVAEIDTPAALAPLEAVVWTVVTVAGLATLVIAGGLVAVWFSEQNAHNRALANQFRDLAARIDAHRRLLTGITGAIAEFIGLKRRDGTYSWVNPAFASALGRTPDLVVGQTDDGLFGHGTARRLESSDAAVIAGRSLPPIEEQVYYGNQLRHVEISKVPMVREDGAVDGIVSVTRDVTELVEQRRLREQAIRQTISALVKTVELADPYLAGHSRLLREFSGLVARRIELPAPEVAAVEIAANLSQIGKPIVPRDILTKPERLTPEEIEIMEKHIEHALDVLHDIPFELPVQDTIAQMYERLDGSGYPAGLSGDDVHIRGRILGACDVFCARIRPRSYRSAIGHEEALQILADHPNRYDARVVEALTEVTRTTEGEKLLLIAATATVPATG